MGRATAMLRQSATADTFGGHDSLLQADGAVWGAMWHHQLHEDSTHAVVACAVPVQTQ